jgi:hypothetical protein
MILAIIGLILVVLILGAQILDASASAYSQDKAEMLWSTLKLAVGGLLATIFFFLAQLFLAALYLIFADIGVQLRVLNHRTRAGI